MLDVNDRINNIILMYNVDRQFKRFRQSLEAIELINKLADTYEDILLVAACESEALLVKDDIRSNKDISYIVIEEGNMVSFNSLIETKSLVLIVSYYHKAEISLMLFEKGIRHISLYEYFTLNGLDLSHDYFDVFGGVWHNPDNKMMTHDFYFYSPYEKIISDKKFLENITDFELRKVCLERIIFRFFYIRDFLSMKKYINEYLANYSDEIIDYPRAWREISDLLSSIKNKLCSRFQNDIWIFIVDAIEYGEDAIMPFLKSVSLDSLVFENAYSSTPYTNPTRLSMFMGIKSIDDLSFKVSEITVNNSDLLKKIEEHGFDFRYFKIKSRISMDYKRHSTHRHQMLPASMMYWDAVNSAINSVKPVLYVVHGCCETHPPFLCADLHNVFYTTKEYHSRLIALQAECCAKYVDKQIEFYAGLLPTNMTKVYMSDHGKSKYGRCHATLKIQSPNIPKGSESRLFSLLDFDKLVDYIISPNEDSYCAMFRERLDIQNPNFHNPFTIAENMNPAPDGFDTELLMGYKGVVTEQDLYVRYYHGEEYFHKHNNDGVLFSQKRADYLRNLVKPDIIDYEREDQFKYTKYTCKVIDRYRVRNSIYETQKTEALKSLFECLDDSLKVAIYTGRETSFKLLLRVGLNLCRKIDFIIDTEPECIAGRIGIQVIDPRNIATHNIDIVIKTIHPETPDRWGHMLYLEKENPPLQAGNYRIIDIYGYLEDRGIKCTRDFWRFEFIESDFDVGFPFLEVLEKKTGIKLL